MRVEADFTFLAGFLVAIVIVLLLSKTSIPRSLYRKLLALVVALTLPAFIPGHGEMVLLLPNGALFAVASIPAKIAGLVFTLINYFIAWFFLFKVGHLFEKPTPENS